MSRRPLETYSAYLDGHCLSDAEVAELRAWIAADEKNAIEFVEFAALHAAITERLRLDRLLDDLASHRSRGGISTTLLAEAIREIESSSPRVLELSESEEPDAVEPDSFRWSYAATFAAISAAMLLALWGIWPKGAEIPIPQVVVDQPAAPQPTAPPPPQIAATLGTSFNARWSKDVEMARHKSFTTGASLTLLSGVAEFRMDGGAIVVVEGPSSFKFTGPESLSLTNGKTAVRVHGPGGSFVVETPTMKVVDLGTEFGVESSPGGAGSVMVFDGVVALGEPVKNDEDSSAVNAALDLPRLEAGFQVALDGRESISDQASRPEALVNPRHFLRPDEIEVRERALAGSRYDLRLAEHFERQRIKGLLAFQPFDSGSLGNEFVIGVHSGVIAVGQTGFSEEDGRGALDVRNGPAFVLFDTSFNGPLARAGYLQPNGRVGTSGKELWLTWTTERVSASADSKGSAGLSLMFGDRSDFDEPIFVGRGFGSAEHFCVQSAWGGAAPPDGDRINVALDVDAAAVGIQTATVDSSPHRWLARVEFREGVDRVSVWLDADPESVALDAPHAVIDAVDVEFDRLRLAVNRGDEVWRFSDVAAATTLDSLIELKKVGTFNIDE